MILPINVQLYYFFSTLVAGLGIGVMYDIYRIIRGFNSPRKYVTAVSDILFWILAAILTFIFLLYTTYGALGYYTVIGVSIGLFLYFKLISKVFIKILRLIIYYFLKILRLIALFVLYPFKLLRHGIIFAFYKSRVGIAVGAREARAGVIKIINKKKSKAGKKKTTKNNKV